MKYVLWIILLTSFSWAEIGHEQGEMAGEVTHNSVIMQSRLTLKDTNIDPRWRVVNGTSGIACFELSTSTDFSNSFRTDWLLARPETDYIIKTKVEGLAAGTRYYYRLLYGENSEHYVTGETCTFKTHIGKNSVEPVRFVVVTGMNYSFFHYMGNRNHPPYNGPDKNLGYPALEAIRKLEPDFFIGTGDNVYYDHPGVAGRAQTQDQIRMKYQEQFSQPRFVELFKTVATYWMKDDHDYRFNDADSVNPILIKNKVSSDYYPKSNIHPKVSGSGFQPSHKLGIRMFREQLPIVNPKDNNAVTFRTYRVNKNLQIWFVEGRDYRSPNDMPDGPDKTIWGYKQKKWLKKTLLDSDAYYKILFSATPMVGPDGASKRDNHVNLRGFRYEGEHFFQWLLDNDFSSEQFFIVCGDRHWQYHAIHPSGFQEFSCGALVDQNAILGVLPGSPRSTDPEGKIKQPYHSPEPSGGFLLISFKPDQKKRELKFDFYDEKGSLLYSY